jgi:hypothetical protein
MTYTEAREALTKLHKLVYSSERIGPISKQHYGGLLEVLINDLHHIFKLEMIKVDDSLPNRH